MRIYRSPKGEGFTEPLRDSKEILTINGFPGIPDTLFGESYWLYNPVDGVYFTMKEKTLVLGLGNTLLGDEGVGVHAIRHLREACPDLGDVELLDGGTLSFALAGPIAEADNLIVIDAAQLDSAPGTLRCYEGADMDRLIRDGRMRSVHEVSLSDLLTIAELSGALPRRRALIGIQPQHIDWSDGLTEPVGKALPEACAQVRKLLLRWRQ